MPEKWSRQLMIELLSLNITGNEILENKQKTLTSKNKFKGSTIIEIKDLVKKFENITAVDKLNLKIMEGEASPLNRLPQKKVIGAMSEMILQGLLDDGTDKKDRTGRNRDE